MSSDSTVLSITFAGDLENVRASTLIASLVSNVKVLQAAKQEIAPDLDLDIRIAAPEKGSFKYALDLSAVMASRGLFENDGYSILKSITDVFSSTLKVRQHLRGDTPQDILHAAEGVAIQNAHGDVIIVNRPTFYVLDRDDVDHALSESFGYLDKEPGIENIIVDDGETIESINRSTFTHISRYGLLSGGSAETKYIEDRAYVHPVRFAIEDRYKWDVYYKGNKISVWIKDSSFFDKVQQGHQRFGKGDAMLVDLRIHQQYDNEIRAYINKSYEIIQIVEYITRCEQLNLEIPRSD